LRVPTNGSAPTKQIALASELLMAEKLVKARIEVLNQQKGRIGWRPFSFLV
jgi:hypothetical protein